MKRRWVYGPVLSRRFGLSLGVDLVPAKLCSYDCVYCQVGKTTHLSVEPSHWVDVEEVLKDVEAAVGESGTPDVVTLAGSGDPTLYDALGSLMQGLREVAGAPVVLLTNGALLYRDDVARAVEEADILAPSLDAGDSETFQKINRPHDEVTFGKMVQGLRRVTHSFQGQVRAEVMLVRGLNDSPESIQAISEILSTLRVNRVDVNTPVRPVKGGEKMVCPREVLERAARIFGPKAFVVAARGRSKKTEGDAESAPEKVYRRVKATISRRPCTATEIGRSLRLRDVEVLKALTRLREEGVLVTREAAPQRSEAGDGQEDSCEERGRRDPEVYYFVSESGG